MAVRYRLEKLNEVQYAYDENRKTQLEAKGFRAVSTEGFPEPDAKPAESAADKEDAAEEDGKPKPVKKPAGRTKAAKGEGKDAG